MTLPVCWSKCPGATGVSTLLLLLYSKLCSCASTSAAVSCLEGGKLISVGNVIQTVAIVGAGEGQGKSLLLLLLSALVPSRGGSSSCAATAADCATGGSAQWIVT